MDAKDHISILKIEVHVFIILYLICRLVFVCIGIVSTVYLCQILCGIYVDHIKIKITKDNTIGPEDCFFLREINTLLLFQKGCIQVP